LFARCDFRGQVGNRHGGCAPRQRDENAGRHWSDLVQALQIVRGEQLEAGGHERVEVCVRSESETDVMGRAATN